MSDVAVVTDLIVNGREKAVADIAAFEAALHHLNQTASEIKTNIDIGGGSGLGSIAKQITDSGVSVGQAIYTAMSNGAREITQAITSSMTSLAGGIKTAFDQGGISAALQMQSAITNAGVSAAQEMAASITAAKALSESPFPNPFGFGPAPNPLETGLRNAMRIPDISGFGPAGFGLAGVNPAGYANGMIGGNVYGGAVSPITGLTGSMGLFSGPNGDPMLGSGVAAGSGISGLTGGNLFTGATPRTFDLTHEFIGPPPAPVFSEWTGNPGGTYGPTPLGSPPIEATGETYGVLGGTYGGMADDPTASLTKRFASNEAASAGGLGAMGNMLLRRLVIVQGVREALSIRNTIQEEDEKVSQFTGAGAFGGTDSKGMRGIMGAQMGADRSMHDGFFVSIGDVERQGFGQIYQLGRKLNPANNAEGYTYTTQYERDRLSIEAMQAAAESTDAHTQEMQRWSGIGSQKDAIRKQLESQASILRYQGQAEIAGMKGSQAIQFRAIAAQRDIESRYAADPSKHESGGQHRLSETAKREMAAEIGALWAGEGVEQTDIAHRTQYETAQNFQQYHSMQVSAWVAQQTAAGQGYQARIADANDQAGAKGRELRAQANYSETQGPEGTIKALQLRKMAEQADIDGAARVKNEIAKINYEKIEDEANTQARITQIRVNAGNERLRATGDAYGAGKGAINASADAKISDLQQQLKDPLITSEHRANLQAQIKAINEGRTFDLGTLDITQAHGTDQLNMRADILGLQGTGRSKLAEEFGIEASIAEAMRDAGSDKARQTAVRRMGAAELQNFAWENRAKPIFGMSGSEYYSHLQNASAQGDQGLMAAMRRIPDELAKLTNPKSNLVAPLSDAAKAWEDATKNFGNFLHDAPKIFRLGS